MLIGFEGTPKAHSKACPSSPTGGKAGKIFEFGDPAFDSETLAILECVFDEAWASNDGRF
jgi:hypothetical protein